MDPEGWFLGSRQMWVPRSGAQVPKATLNV